MALTVKQQAEPLTRNSLLTPPILAESEEYRRLYRDLERYTRGDIPGRSYLIAGHRGSGKTTLVYKALEDVQRLFLNAPLRPLFVRLHGPDLLPPLPAEPQAAEAPAATPLNNQIAIAFSGDSPATVSTGKAESNDAKGDAELANVLTQMMKCLFRDVIIEFARRFRSSVEESAQQSVRREELLEVAAQLHFEIQDCPSTARLRAYWAQGGFLRSGVLFSAQRESSARLNMPGASASVQSTVEVDRGLQEIVALSMLGQAFKVVSGKIEEKLKQTEEAKSTRQLSLETAYALKNLLAPLAGLVTGGLVGTELAFHSGNPFAAVLLGLFTGSVVSFSFGYSASSSRNKEMSLEQVFIKDRSIATLTGVLPLLIRKFQEIGLAPVFVIDELDKVQNLNDRMKKLVQQLKFLVTERSFTCFLTDRRYWEYINSQAVEKAYAPEYTYFSDRLLVLYRPQELRDYVKAMLEPEAGPAAASQNALDKNSEDKEKIAYVLLRQACLHPIDLRRQLDRLATRRSVSMDDFAAPGYRFEILMQTAIEWLIEGQDVQAQIAGKPETRQLVYDALYYLPRRWETATIDQEVSLDSDSFSEYLKSRWAAEEELTARPADGTSREISGTDFNFLFLKAQELLNLVYNPSDLLDKINASKRPNKPEQFILNEIPKDRPLRLLERIPGERRYRWLHDVSGQPLKARGVSTVLTGELAESQSVIRGIAESLSVFRRISLQTLAELKVMPRTPEWRAVQTSLGRLDKLMLDPESNAYAAMGADHDSVLEFANAVRDFEQNIKAALICASRFAAELTIFQDPDAQLLEALKIVSQQLRLAASKDEDLRRLTIAMTPAGAPNLVLYQDQGKVFEFVDKTRKEKSPIDSDVLAKTLPDLWKDRFTIRYRDGTGSFDWQFEDLLGWVRNVFPARLFGTDLNSVSAAQWSDLLNHPLGANAPSQPADWLVIVALLETGFYQAAQELARQWRESAPAPIDDWVRDASARVPATANTRSSVLVWTSAERSLTADWKPSSRYAALVLPAPAFENLILLLSARVFQFRLIFIEVPGDRRRTGQLVSKSFIEVLATLYPTSKPSSTLLSLIAEAEVHYFTAEPPLVAQGSDPIAVVVSGVRSLDELIEHPSLSAKPTAAAASA